MHIANFSDYNYEITLVDSSEHRGNIIKVILFLMMVVEERTVYLFAELNK